jgi:hypothetical protein
MTPEGALILTTLFWAVAGFVATGIAVHQSVRLVRAVGHHDKHWWFRLMSVLVFGSLGVTKLRNVAIWTDYIWFDQQLMGTIQQRWPLDLALATLTMAACLLATVLYVQTQQGERT